MTDVWVWLSYGSHKKSGKNDLKLNSSEKYSIFKKKQQFVQAKGAKGDRSSNGIRGKYVLFLAFCDKQVSKQVIQDDQIYKLYTKLKKGIL